MQHLLVLLLLTPLPQFLLFSWGIQLRMKKDEVEYFCSTLIFFFFYRHIFISISIIKKPLSVQPYSSWLAFYSWQTWYVVQQANIDFSHSSVLSNIFSWLGNFSIPLNHDLPSKIAPVMWLFDCYSNIINHDITDTNHCHASS